MRVRHLQFDAGFARRSSCACLLPLVALYAVGCKSADGKTGSGGTESPSCTALCTDIDITTFPGCDLTCGVDAADQVKAGVVVDVFGVGLGATGNVDDPETCELAVSNCELDDCAKIYATCLNEDEPSYCAGIYADCLAEEAIEAGEQRCSDDYDTCVNAAIDALQICEDHAKNPAELDDCDEAYEYDEFACHCNELACTDELENDPGCTEDDGSASTSTTSSMVMPVQVATNHWVLPRGLVNAQFGQLGKLAQATGAARSRRKGQRESDGVRLWWIDRHSVLGGIGLRPGDRLLSVNGIPLRASNLTLPVLAPLASANTVTLTLERGTKTLSLVYDIADPRR